MANHFLNFWKFIIKERSIIITAIFLGGIIGLGIARLVLRNNFDIINLIPIIAKSLGASLALLFIFVSFTIRRMTQPNQDVGHTKLEKVVIEIWWISLNFFAIYFLLTTTLAGEFHFKLTDNMAKIVIAIVVALLISLWAEIKIKKK